MPSDLSRRRARGPQGAPAATPGARGVDRAVGGRPQEVETSRHAPARATAGRRAERDDLDVDGGPLSRSPRLPTWWCGRSRPAWAARSEGGVAYQTFHAWPGGARRRREPRERCPGPQRECADRPCPGSRTSPFVNDVSAPHRSAEHPMSSTSRLISRSRSGGPAPRRCQQGPQRADSGAGRPGCPSGRKSDVRARGARLRRACTSLQPNGDQTGQRHRSGRPRRRGSLPAMTPPAPRTLPGGMTSADLHPDAPTLDDLAGRQAELERLATVPLVNSCGCEGPPRMTSTCTPPRPRRRRRLRCPRSRAPGRVSPAGVTWAVVAPREPTGLVRVAELRPMPSPPPRPLAPPVGRPRDERSTIVLAGQRRPQRPEVLRALRRTPRPERWPHGRAPGRAV